jgi:dimethylglycine dehydrogenase
MLNQSDAIGTLVVAGPRSRELMAHVTAEDLSNAAFPWLAARTIDVLGNPTLVLRVNYVGELGWELHAPMEQLPGIYDALSAAGPNYGLRDFGLYAMDSLRLDKGYRDWKTDIETGYSPYEASLDRFVSLQKSAFVGQEALIREAKRSAAWRKDSCLLHSTTKATPTRLPARRCCFEVRMSDLSPQEVGASL